MNANEIPPVLNPALSPGRVLRRLFLTLFLRGRSSRGLNKSGSPKSVGSKLALILVIYAAVGFVAFGFIRQPLFTLSLYLHAMTFGLLGMFVASSAGEMLFNKEESDILLHRPVSPRQLLWAKIGVLVQVSLWLAGAFNLAGFFVGTQVSDGGWIFIVAHAISTAVQALFCTGCVVLAYQLCLRWCGRERLEGLMTAAQVFVAIAAVLGGQIVPRLIGRMNGKVLFNVDSWWIGLLPPAWFAGFDDAIAGQGSMSSWILAAIGLIATATVLWFAFGKLAQDYETGLKSLNEGVSAKPRQRTHRRWSTILVNTAPFRWWLRDPISRASFLLTVAYLARDRETKLRIYPGLAPLLVMPFIFLFQDAGRSNAGGMGNFGIAFSGSYVGLVPLLALSMLQYSQQWQAADLFRAAPMRGPAPLCDGARRAVLFFLTLPLLILFGALAWMLHSDSSNLPLLLPGIIAVPIYAMIPCLGGKAVPFCIPGEEAKAAGRGLIMIGVMLASAALGGLALWSWSGGWFWWLVLAETIVVISLYLVMRRSLSSTRWPSLD